MTGFKSQGKKVLLALGGWNDSAGVWTKLFNVCSFYNTNDSLYSTHTILFYIQSYVFYFYILFWIYQGVSTASWWTRLRRGAHSWSRPWPSSPSTTSTAWTWTGSTPSAGRWTAQQVGSTDCACAMAATFNPFTTTHQCTGVFFREFCY